MRRKRITMGAGDFKAKCLQIMDDVEENHIEVVITKRGKPVARLVSVEPVERVSAFGWLRGTVTELADIVSSDEDEWPETEQ